MCVIQGDQNTEITQQEDEAEMTLEDLLGKLGLQDYAEAFAKEQIDMESLVS